MNTMKKLLASFLVALTLFVSAAPFIQAKAQAVWYNQSPFQWYSKVYDDTNPNEIFGERYTAAQVQWITYSFIFLPINMVFSLLNVPPTPMVCISNLGSGVTTVNDCIEATITSINAIAGNLKLASVDSTKTVTSTSSTNMWSDIFSGNRPLSGIGYTKDLISKLKPVSQVKAADNSFGFNKLLPIQSIWKVTRNIAYFFFVLITIVVAFMIMFKVKISPQVVISVQQALPKIVISILLVTFSYAIAGFMVDLVYVVMGIFSQFFGPILGSGVNNGQATYLFLNGWTPDGFITLIIYSVLYIILSIVISLLVAVSAFLTLNTSSFIFGAVLIIFFMINIIILIVYIFIGLFNLFKALANFYIDVILGPIKLALGALPGSQSSFGGWLKSLAGRLAVFPVTGILWYFGFYFLIQALFAIITCANVDLPDNFASKISMTISGLFTSVGAGDTALAKMLAYNRLLSGQCWGPPLLGNSGSATAIAFILISATSILAIAKVPKMIESAIAGKPFDLESAIGDVTKYGSRGVGVVGAGVSYFGGQRANQAQTDLNAALARNDRQAMEQAQNRLNKAQEMTRIGGTMQSASKSI